MQKYCQLKTVGQGISYISLRQKPDEFCVIVCETTINSSMYNTKNLIS